MKRLRRWWVRTLRTRVEPSTYNRNAGKVMVLELGQKPIDAFDFVPGYKVSRPDWWTWGSRSGVTDETVEVARRRLDKWQDDMAARA